MVWAALLVMLLVTQGDDMGVARSVTDEVDNIRTARELLGLERSRHPLELWLALSHVESHGENIQDTDSYVGKLQIGDAYYEDAWRWLAKRHPDVIGAYDLPAPHKRVRMVTRTDDALPYVIAMAYMERYASRHDYDPFRMAGMHKGGIGSASQVALHMRRGKTVFEAMRHVSRTWKSKKTGRLLVPRLYLYVTGRDAGTGRLAGEFRFAQAFRDYAAWVDAKEGDGVDDELGGGELERLITNVVGSALGRLASRFFGGAA